MTVEQPRAAAEAAGGWLPVAASVKPGRKSHRQDRHCAFAAAGGRAIVLAAADGHGSAAHFRSDLGARWAVEVFAESAAEFAAYASAEGGAAERWGRVRSAAQDLTEQVVRRWRGRVALHEANAPAHGLAAAGGRPGGDPDAYGSTLLGAVVTEHLVVCWQLGDGDVVLVRDGAAHTPFTHGPDLGDETDSLCQPEAWRRMRVHWHPVVDGGPPHVLLSTDGLSKSFAEQRGFLAFAVGAVERAEQDGVGALAERLPHWLARAAEHSGDDTTLVAAVRPAAGAGTD